MTRYIEVWNIFSIFVNKQTFSVLVECFPYIFNIRTILPWLLSYLKCRFGRAHNLQELIINIDAILTTYNIYFYQNVGKWIVYCVYLITLTWISFEQTCRQVKVSIVLYLHVLQTLSFQRNRIYAWQRAALWRVCRIPTSNITGTIRQTFVLLTFL